MQPFSYVRVSTVEEALAQLAADAQARPIAGGTALLDLMQLGVVAPTRLIDISRLPLDYIEVREGHELRIGALAHHSDLAFHPVIRRRFPALAAACLATASPQLRNMATLGGDLLQRPRCVYFRDGQSPCNRRVSGSGCAALAGPHRDHAVLAGSDRCIAVHPSDLCVALLALDATVRLRSEAGERTVPLADFHLLPDAAPPREVVLAPRELIVEVLVPPSPRAARSRFIKVADRAAFAFALVSAAAAVQLDGGIIQSARLALGGVAPKPWRATAAERTLIGVRVDGEAAKSASAFDAAAAAALREAVPRGDNAFKIELSRRCLVRALREATTGACGGGLLAGGSLELGQEPRACPTE